MNEEKYWVVYKYFYNGETIVDYRVALEFYATQEEASHDMFLMAYNEFSHLVSRDEQSKMFSSDIQILFEDGYDDIYKMEVVCDEDTETFKRFTIFEKRDGIYCPIRKFECGECYATNASDLIVNIESK